MESMKDFYYKHYHSSVVDAAYNPDYNYEANSKEDIIKIELVGTDIPKEEKDKIAERLSQHLVDNCAGAFIHGVQYAVYNEIGELKSDNKDAYSEYHKNKDLCIFFNYGDNDFGSYMEDVAKTFAMRYNSLLAQIDTYEKISPEMTKSYLKRIEMMEQPKTIQQILSMAFVSSHIGNNASDNRNEFGDDFTVKDAYDGAFDTMKYCGLDSSDGIRIGTYDEILSYVSEKYKYCQDEWKEDGTRPLERHWLNGEAIILICNGDGWMKAYCR